MCYHKTNRVKALLILFKDLQYKKASKQINHRGHISLRQLLMFNIIIHFHLVYRVLLYKQNQITYIYTFAVQYKWKNATMQLNKYIKNASYLLEEYFC